MLVGCAIDLDVFRPWLGLRGVGGVNHSEKFDHDSFNARASFNANALCIYSFDKHPRDRQRTNRSTKSVIKTPQERNLVASNNICNALQVSRWKKAS